MRTRLALFAVILTTTVACTTTPAPSAGGAGAAKVEANLGQIMKGIMYINSNVIFAAQGTNPADIKAEGDS